MSPVKASYPSNIALIKYWGKHGNQLPCNPSLSLTLSQARTEVTLYCEAKKQEGIALDYLFEGAPKPAFRDRIVDYISRQNEFADLLRNYELRIESSNTFPHSAGIASSASAFAAIAAALLKAAQPHLDETEFLRSASRLARLGSGSACRSFYGPYAQWGASALPHSSDDYAVPVTEIHENFRDMRDAILIVEDAPKKVSSSVGHGLMKGHPFANARFEQARHHCDQMREVLRNGDFDSFIAITEREALTLHALMMSSGDYYMLMKPGTVQIIDQVFAFRQDTGTPVCFTLDAGPNIHLLYPAHTENQVKDFIATLGGGMKSVIYDAAGTGGTVF